MSTQPGQKRLLIRWTTLRGLITLIVFLAVAALIEYLVVLYAIGLGVKDTSALQWSFQFPGTGWPVTITISPLFHLVPISVMITLAFSWSYLTKSIASRRQEIRRGKVETFTKQRIEKKGFASRMSRAVKNAFKRVKSRLARTRGVSYLSQRIRLPRPTVRSALIVLLIFLAFIMVFSLLAFPQLIYQVVSNAYRNNPWLLNFVISVDNWAKGFAQALGPIGWISTSINNGLLSAAPGMGSFGTALGGLISPLASLDTSAKFLVFQNAAAWVSVLVVLVFGERMGKAYRYKK